MMYDLGFGGYSLASSYAGATDYSPVSGVHYASGSSQYDSSTPTFTQTTSYSDYSFDILPETLNFVAKDFLVPDRPKTAFITSTDEVKAVIHEAFRATTGNVFPDGISVHVLDDENFRKLHAAFGNWNEGILGFSINRYGKGISEIFVRNDHLDRLLLTIGHEIGHVLSPSLPNLQDEEAKAHAFSLAWIETIADQNIGDLSPNVVPNPAQNGLHDVAFDFVNKLLNAGSSPYDVFLTLSKGLVSIVRTLEVL